MNAIRVAAKTLFAAADLVFPRLLGPRILIYHQVGSGRTHEMNISVEGFRRQLVWMRSHGEIVSLEEAIRRRGEPDSHRLFVLTFDDGYAGVFTNAFPVMQQRRIPFTLYLTSGPIEKPDSYPDWPGEPLTWNQVRQMLESNLVTVGAHTDTHPDLRYLGPNAASAELLESNALIEARCGVKPRHFTYPWGCWSLSADATVRATYETATLGSGSGISCDSDLHLLHRIPVQRSDPMLLFQAKIKTGGRSENRIRRRFHGYDGP